MNAVNLSMTFDDDLSDGFKKGAGNLRVSGTTILLAIKYLTRMALNSGRKAYQPFGRLPSVS